ncbi:MAG: SusC/RagA family TonB-linked outer membrane protein [Flammeovirgaceae bacterium]
MKSKLILLTLPILLLLGFQAFAQDLEISGTVVDENGQGLPGVNIVIKGTTTGTSTDVDGKYRMKVPKSSGFIVFSYIGYIAQEVALNNQSVIDITMQPEVNQLADIVITAFGVKKEEKALGYAVSTLSGADISLVKEPNMVNAISGKIAGVQVNRTAGGPGSSTRVIIRGNNSLIGNNQPLYVVDGIPVDNQSLGGAGRWGGIDYGNGAGELNADDIANMSVLKGPNAAALYGTRAANGVILITTKRGDEREGGIGIEFNSNLTLENALVLPDVQNTYGHGTGGQVPAALSDILDLGSGANLSSSWGPAMNGQNELFWDGTTRPMTAQPDNIKDFYQTGYTFTNTIALSGHTSKSYVRLSASDLRNEGIIPTSEFKRNSFMLRGGSKLTNKLSTDIKANYIRIEGHNRPNLADIMDNPANGLMWMPRSVDINNLKNFENGDGTHRFYNVGAFRLNPYWALNRNTNDDVKDRILGFVSAKYEFTDWLSLQVRTGMDYSNHQRSRRVVKNTPYRPDGEIEYREYTILERNSDFLFEAKKDFSDEFKVTALFGGNLLYQRNTLTGYNGLGLVIPGFYHISNANSVTEYQNLSERKIHSLYGQVNFDFKNVLFLDITARNDWSSTLPIDNNSFFYPSANLSFSFTDALNLDDRILSYGKVRASIAKVGNDTSPYQLATTYGVRTLTLPDPNDPSKTINVPLGFLGDLDAQFVPTNNFIPLSTLKPESTVSMEFGLDLRFFRDRLSFDIAYYKSNTTDQILPTVVSKSTGFTSAIINVGEMENKGIELGISATPIKLDNGLEWEVGFNYARNRNQVVSLIDGLDQLPLAFDRAISIQAKPGEPYGALVGFGYKRDDAGNLVLNENGLPTRTDAVEVLGNSIPDWIGGIRNTINFKNFSLSALVDIRHGGHIFSQTNRYLHVNGNHVNTLAGRETGIELSGVDASGQATSSTVEAEDYWRHVFDREIAEDFVYDASFIKLRQLAIGYTLPSSLLDKLPFYEVSFSLVGSNLFFFKNNVPGLDPEATYTSGNGQGIESGSIPSTRSLGFNLNLKL